MSEKDYSSKQDSVHKSKINMSKEISKQFKADQRRIFEDILSDRTVTSLSTYVVSIFHFKIL